jgi:hypothetical protein
MPDAIACEAECRHGLLCEMFYSLDHPHPQETGMPHHYAFADDGQVHEWNGDGPCRVSDPEAS